jgi:hypothetical protein
VSLANVRVSQDGKRVWLEGTELRGVTSVEVHRAVGDPIRVKLEIITDRLEMVDEATMSMTMDEDFMKKMAGLLSPDEPVVMTCDHPEHSGQDMTRAEAATSYPGCTTASLATVGDPPAPDVGRLVEDLGALGDDLLRGGVDSKA